MNYTILLVLAIACFAAPALAEEPTPKQRIAAADDRIQEVIKVWKEALSEGRPLPAEDLLGAMRGLGSIPARAALEKLAGYLGHRDAGVARCAVQGLMAPEDKALLLLSGRLIARQLAAKQYRPERRDLFIDQVYALGASGYLGAFDRLKAMLRKVQDGEVVALAAETLAHLEDYRAITVLEDWASWDRGYNDRAGSAVDTGRSRQLPAGTKPAAPRVAGTPLPGTNRQNSAREAWPKPGEQWVRDAVYEAFFVLIGREGRGFDTYEEYTKFMVNHREEHKRKAKATEARLREQEKQIKSCP